MGRYTVRFLIVITALSWGALFAETEGNLLNSKGFAVLCVLSALAPVLLALTLALKLILAALRAHSERMEKATAEHAQTMRESMADHKKCIQEELQHLSEKQTVLERGLQVVKDMTYTVGRDVDDYINSPSDTGPFPLYGNGSMS